MWKHLTTQCRYRDVVFPRQMVFLVALAIPFAGLLFWRSRLSARKLAILILTIFGPYCVSDFVRDDSWRLFDLLQWAGVARIFRVVTGYRDPRRSFPEQCWSAKQQDCLYAQLSVDG